MDGFSRLAVSWRGLGELSPYFLTETSRRECRAGTVYRILVNLWYAVLVCLWAMVNLLAFFGLDVFLGIFQNERRDRCNGSTKQ